MFLLCKFYTINIISVIHQIHQNIASHQFVYDIIIIHLHQHKRSILTFDATSSEWLFIRASNYRNHSLASGFLKDSRIHVYIPGRFLLRVLIAKTQLTHLYSFFRYVPVLYVPRTRSRGRPRCCRSPW